MGHGEHVTATTNEAVRRGERVRQDVIAVSVDLPNRYVETVFVRLPTKKGHGGPTKEVTVGVGQLAQEALRDRAEKPTGGGQRDLCRGRRYAAAAGEEGAWPRAS